MNPSGPGRSPGFEPLRIEELLVRSDRFLLYRAFQENQALPLWLQLPAGGLSDPERLRRQRTLLAQLTAAAVPRLFEAEPPAPLAALTYYAEPGHSLVTEIDGQAWALPRFLAFAAAAARAMITLHTRGVVHQALTPEAIWLLPADPEPRVLFLDFDRAASSDETLELSASALPYTAPELTGQLDRRVDDRADLYSLGILFFELLAGRRPFVAADSLALIHHQVAHAAPSLCALREDAPLLLAELIARLLEKDPERRYPSAESLLDDLTEARARLAGAGHIAPFPLARPVQSGRFEPSQTLFGRAEELSVLSARLDARGTLARPALLLLSGPSGIGKTALAQALLRLEPKRPGRFVSGKVDQFRRDIPYAAVRQALSELVSLLLALPEDALDDERRRIQRAVGNFGHLLLELAPRLERVIGPQPELPALPAADSERILDATFRNLIEAVNTPERPLYFCLDDLQWLDPASARLIEQLFCHPGARGVGLIATLRSDEGPRPEWLERLLANQTVESVVIELGGLSVGELGQIIERSFGIRDLALAAQIHERTAGNPFFVFQFLAELHREGVLRFDAEARAWRFDGAAIAERPHRPNVLEWMIGRLASLPGPARRLLRIAASIGSEVSTGALARHSGHPEAALEQLLAPALAERLLRRVPNGFEFVHDRIQHAAYLSDAAEDPAALHLRIARSSTEALAEDNLYDTVDHWLHAAALVEAPEEREHAAKLALRAAKLALAQSAVQNASRYIDAARAWLAGLGEAAPAALSFEVELEFARIELLTGRLTSAAEQLELLLGKALSDRSAARIHRLRVDVFTALGRPADGIQAAAECVARLGMTLETNPSPADLEAAERALRIAFAGRPIEAIAELPQADDALVVEAMDALVVLLASAWFTSYALHHLITMRMMEISFTHGVTPATANGMAAYAIHTCQDPAHSGETRRYDRVARELSERPEFSRFRFQTALTLASSVEPFHNHQRAVIENLQRALEVSGETTDPNWLCFGYAGLTLQQLGLGLPLAEVERTVRVAIDISARFGIHYMLSTFEFTLAFIECLRGNTESPASFACPDFDERGFLKQIGERVPMSQFTYHALKLRAALIFGAPEDALEHLAAADSLRWTWSNSGVFFEYAFVSGLVAARAATTRSGAERAQHCARLALELEHLRRVARACPVNFEHKALALEAELARLEGRPFEALERYEQAAALAVDFTHDRALILERTMEFARERSLPRLEALYRNDAAQTYARWGARLKHERLSDPDPYALLLREPHSILSSRLARDAQTVIKASQAISSDLVLPELLVTLMRIVVEHAGVPRGHLVLFEERGLSLAASVDVDRAIKLCDPGEPATSAQLPLGLLNYVRRSEESLALEDPVRDPRFADDPYFASARPRSVLCLLLSHKNERVGVLYLEHPTAAGCFRHETRQVLEFLANQAAISLDNARLFAESADSVRAHDAFLSTAAHELRTPLTALMYSLQGLLRLQAKQPVSERMQNALEVAERQAKRLSRLISSLLDVSRIQSARFEIELATVDLEEALNEVLRDLREGAERAGCPLMVRTAPIRGRWDPARIEQVLSSLISNALKFGAGAPIEVELSQVGSRVRIVVADQGPGIAPAAQRWLFVRFPRNRRPLGGLGLSLFITRCILEAHGGTIRYEANEPRGSRFVAELPIDSSGRRTAETAR